jgi:hypothetical protein
MQRSFGLFAIIAFVFALQLSPRSAIAQGEEGGPVPESTGRTAKNVLYVELLGNGGIYSVNYERFVTDDMNLRLGFDYLSLSLTGTDSSGNKASGSATVLFIPLMFNYFGVGSLNHKLELGAGPLFVYASGEASSLGDQASASGFAVAGTATIGYRYVPHDGGFNFKIGFTPIFGQGGFLPFGGLGLGAVF